MAGLDQSERDLAIFTRMLNEVTKKYSLLMQGGGGVGVAAAAAMGDDGQQQHEFLQSQEQRRASLSMLSREAAKIIVCVRKRPLNERGRKVILPLKLKP